MTRAARFIAAVVVGLALPGFAAAAECPADVAQAKSKLRAAQAPGKTAATTTDTQSPRSAAGYQGGSSEAPRSTAQASTGDVQAPRGGAQASTGDVQAPRGKGQASSGDVQAPRGGAQAGTGDVQAPRGGAQAGTGDVQAPRATKTQLASARKLITEAEQACKKGDMAAASAKAKEAMALLP